MRTPLVLSILFHAAILITALIPWPGSEQDLARLGGVQSFEVVAEAETAPPPIPERPSEPKPAPAPPPAPERPPEPKPPPPPPPPSLPSPPEPQPEPEPEPEPRQIQTPPVFRPTAKPLEPEKPKPDFASSVLNTLARTDEAPNPKREKTDPPKEVTTLDQAVAAALNRNPARNVPTRTRVSSPGLTDSELAVVRDQIARCWNPPVGAANARDMLAVLEIRMNRDGTVAFARVTELSESATKQFGESVVRAVKRCQPLKLPDGKFAEWKKIILTFTPRDMVF